MVLTMLALLLSIALQANEIYDIVPLPQDIRLQKGQPFILDGNVQILTASDLQREALFLRDYIREQTGLELAVTDRHNRKVRTIALTVSPSVTHPEGYRLDVSKDGINWQRCSDEPFLRNGLPGEWNESESGHPCVYKDRQGQTHLFYQGNNSHGKHWLLTSVPLKWSKRLPEIVYPEACGSSPLLWRGGGGSSSMPTRPIPLSFAWPTPTMRQPLRATNRMPISATAQRTC